jgi:hypothetical protein
MLAPIKFPLDLSLARVVSKLNLREPYYLVEIYFLALYG